MSQTGIMLSILKPVQDVYQRFFGAKAKSAQGCSFVEPVTTTPDPKHRTTTQFKCKPLEAWDNLTDEQNQGIDYSKVSVVEKDPSIKTDGLLEESSERAEHDLQCRSWYPGQWSIDHADNYSQVSKTHCQFTLNVLFYEHNVDELRMMDEPDEEWKTRKRFILDNQLIYPMKDLINLSKAFINCMPEKEALNETCSQSCKLVEAPEKYNGQNLNSLSSKRKRDAICDGVQQTLEECWNKPKMRKVQDEPNKVVCKESKERSKSRRILRNRADRSFPSERFVFNRTEPPVCIGKELKNKVKFVLVECAKDSAISILCRAAGDYKVKMKWEFSRYKKKYRCKFTFNTDFLAEAEGRSYLDAKEKAARLGLECLQKYNHTIRVSESLDMSCRSISREDFEALPQRKVNDPLEHHNVESKTNISLDSFPNSLGGGIEVEKVLAKKSFENKCFQFLEMFIKEGSLDDLVFVSFTLDEICLIEEIASKMGFTTERLGGKKARKLRAIRVRPVEEVLDFLQQMGNSFGRYKLIKPKLLQHVKDSLSDIFFRV